MAKRSKKAFAAVEAALKNDAGASMADLRAAAEKADPRIKKVGGRSFNASYVLPLKRAAGGGSPRPRKAKRKARKKAARKAQGKATGRRRQRISGAARQRLRELILDRDQRVLQAISGDDPRAAYELGSGLDGYIDELAASVRG